MRNTLPLLALLFTAATASAPSPSTAQTVDGAFVVQRMHDAYAGKWYKSLTFTQKTTRYKRDGSDTVETWFESLQYVPGRGTVLRIDIGDLANGRGILYTADSSWRMQKGAVASVAADGNEFLPLIESVYLQPVDRTVAELAHHDIDMKVGYATTIEGMPMWVVGAASASDSTRSQFTVDTVRKVVTRMVIGRGTNQPVIDVRLGGYERAGKGWLATKVVMSMGGRPLQTEEYSGWKLDVNLAPALFDPAQWMTAKHWAKSN